MQNTREKNYCVSHGLNMCTAAGHKRESGCCASEALALCILGADNVGCTQHRLFTWPVAARCSAGLAGPRVFTDSQVPASGHSLSLWVTHHVTPCASQKHLSRRSGCLLEAAAAAHDCNDCCLEKKRNKLLFTDLDYLSRPHCSTTLLTTNGAAFRTGPVCLTICAQSAHHSSPARLVRITLWARSRRSQPPLPQLCPCRPHSSRPLTATSLPPGSCQAPLQRTKAS